MLNDYLTVSPHPSWRAMTMPRVIVARGVLNAFVRGAKKAYPKEYIEAVLGKVEGAAFVIHAFYPLEHRGTARTVEFNAEALEEVRQVAQELELRWIGSIHTHPECEAVPVGLRH